MPRRTAIPERHHRAIDPREFYEYTTPRLQSFARALDVYSSPGGVPHVYRSGDIEAAKSTIDNIISGISSWAALKKIEAKEQKEAGQQAAMRGDPIPEGASDAFIAGHEELKGSAAASELEAILAQHYDAAKDLDPREFAESRKKIIREFTAGRSPHFLRGLLPKALVLEAKYSGQYEQYQREKLKETGLSYLVSSFSNDFDMVSENSQLSPEEKQAQARKLMTSYQVIGNSMYGLSKTEITEALIHAFGQRAVETGNPGLLGIFGLPDDDGVRPVDNVGLGRLVFSYRRSAESEYNRRVNEAERLKEQQRKNIEESVANAALLAIADPLTSTKDITALITKYSDPRLNPEGVVLPPSTTRILLSAIENRSMGYGRETDITVFAPAVEKAARGELTVEDLALIKSRLTQADAKHLAELNARNAAGAGSKSTSRKFFEKIQRETAMASSKPNTITGEILDKNGYERHLYIVHASEEWFYKFTEDNKREPTLDEISTFLKKAREQAEQLYPTMPEAAVPMPSSAPAKPLAGAPKPGPEPEAKRGLSSINPYTREDRQRRLDLLKQKRGETREPEAENNAPLY